MKKEVKLLIYGLQKSIEYLKSREIYKVQLQVLYLPFLMISIGYIPQENKFLELVDYGPASNCLLAVAVEF